MYKIIPVDPFDLAIFGGTSDLARRELLPGLYRRFQVGQLPPESSIICMARSPYTTESYRNFVRDTVETNILPTLRNHDTLNSFLKLVDYQPLDVDDDTGWRQLANRFHGNRTSAYYLSVRPGLFPAIISGLEKNGLAHPGSRIVVEKPFGHDLASARILNEALSAAFDESQIYRIDHYLGKETVQNLMALRFANVFFEPLWNGRYIENIQITVAESAGVAGRGDYYDRSGAMRDMVQNHLMQLLCLVAMEPPATFDADAVRDEKLKVINALKPPEDNDIVLGQYGAGQGHASYRDDIGNGKSNTESYVALKCTISNWRWASTPFYLRTGKRMSRRVSEIAVRFRKLPHWIFDETRQIRGNLLAIRLQPDEGIDLRVTIKEPGPGGMRLVEVPLDMSFAGTLTSGATELINAYERLIMDVIRGNQTLFMRGDEVEAAWRWTDHVLAVSRTGSIPVQTYGAGSQGPASADALLARTGHQWRPVEPQDIADPLIRSG